MSDNATAVNARPAVLKVLAAILRRVAYVIAVLHGIKTPWTDLRTALYTVLDDRVKHLEIELARLGWPGNCEASRELLSAELTDVAYRVILRHGVRGSFLELELGLYHAFCQVVIAIG
jgi:hypothetical protein